MQKSRISLNKIDLNFIEKNQRICSIYVRSRSQFKKSWISGLIKFIYFENRAINRINYF